MGTEDTTDTEVSVSEAFPSPKGRRLIMSTDSIPTQLGRIHVRHEGSGPPVVLWHSLFVDSASWGPLFDRVREDHRAIAIDGPCHGRSEGLTHDFTFDEVADCAVAVMDALALHGPVDWVGNAWGGHIGIKVAARHPRRLRTLTTIGTPLRPINPRERWTMCWPLVQIYRVTGPNRWLRTQLQNALIGPRTAGAHPDRACEIMRAFVDADRRPMFHAMRSMMLHRPDVTADLASIAVPTLMMVADSDSMGAGPDDIHSATSAMSHVHVGGLVGDGHLTPLIVDQDNIYRQLVGHWSDNYADSRF
jgi:pimeloyl-ACP methyl ester carboxylesterase